MKPRIAIPADTFTDATNVINERMAAFAPRTVVDAVLKAGGVPVILPSIDPSYVNDYLQMCDGVAFLGGFDVDPTFYNEEPDLKLGMTYLTRDRFEIALVKAALENGKAILGICRGAQVINVALGGTLYQDLSLNPEATIKHSQLAPGNLPTHHINIAADSELYSLLGARPYVNSRHHQAIKTVAPSLKVVAKADDGVIEAVESQRNNQIVAVQWHPENMFKHDVKMRAIFDNFIARCSQPKD